MAKAGLDPALTFQAAPSVCLWKLRFSLWYARYCVLFCFNFIIYIFNYHPSAPSSLATISFFSVTMDLFLFYLFGLFFLDFTYVRSYSTIFYL